MGRVAAVFLVGGTAFGAAGGWALYETLHNPRVPLAAPAEVRRAPRAPGRAEVVLGGDFAPTDAAMPLVRAHGFTYPYLATAPILRDADVAFANLEAPVTARGERFPLYKDYFYRV